MATVKKVCKYCGLECKVQKDSLFLLSSTENECDKCHPIRSVIDYVIKYSNNHKDAVWRNKIHERNMKKDSVQIGKGVDSFTLDEHKTTHRIVNRTKRVTTIIDKINHIRNYLYLNLNPIFEILNSIYIKNDCFWKEGGNLISYVHYCCFQEAVLKLHELLKNKKCKYSIPKLITCLQNEEKYVFHDHKVYERIEFLSSKDIMEVEYKSFNIESFGKIVLKAIDDVDGTLKAFDYYRDKAFAHIDDLNPENSSYKFSYSDLKRVFSLTKAIYDSLLYAVAPDRYAAIVFESNIWFSHLNEISKDYESAMKKRKSNESEESLSNK